MKPTPTINSDGTIHCEKCGENFFSMKLLKYKKPPVQCPICKRYKYWIPRGRK